MRPQKGFGQIVMYFFVEILHIPFHWKWGQNPFEVAFIHKTISKIPKAIQENAQK